MHFFWVFIGTAVGSEVIGWPRTFRLGQTFKTTPNVSSHKYRAISFWCSQMLFWWTVKQIWKYSVYITFIKSFCSFANQLVLKFFKKVFYCIKSILINNDDMKYRSTSSANSFVNPFVSPGVIYRPGDPTPHWWSVMQSLIKHRLNSDHNW